MPEQYLPAARKSKLLVRELAEEVVVYDEEGHRAHCLNRTAALVWKSCDGRTNVSGIAERVGGQLAAPVSDELVCLALEQLADSDLLAPAVPRPTPPDRVSRRKMLSRLGAAAVLIPLIASIDSPTVAQAESCIPCSPENPCPGEMSCDAGCCVGGA